MLCELRAFIHNCVKVKEHFLICYCLPLLFIRIGGVKRNGFYLFFEFLFVSLYFPYLLSKIPGIRNILDFKIFQIWGVMIPILTIVFSPKI